MLYMPPCTDGRGYRQDHDAEGWLYSPEGRPIIAQCHAHAQAVIAEYAAKLDEQWTFRRAEGAEAI